MSQSQREARWEEPTILAINCSASFSTVSHILALSDLEDEHRGWEPRQTGSYVQPQPRGQGIMLNIHPCRSQKIVISKRIGKLENEHA